MALLVVLRIVAILPTYCNSARETRMRKFTMRTLSSAGNHLKTGVTKILKELSNLARHNGYVSPFQQSCKANEAQDCHRLFSSL